MEDISELVDQIFAFFLVFFVRDRAHVLEVFQFEQFLSGVFFGGRGFVCVDFILDDARGLLVFRNGCGGIFAVRISNQIEDSANDPAEDNIADANPNCLFVLLDAVGGNSAKNAAKDGPTKVEQGKDKVDFIAGREKENKVQNR